MDDGRHGRALTFGDLFPCGNQEIDDPINIIYGVGKRRLLHLCQLRPERGHG